MTAVQEIVNDLEKEANNKITKAEEAGDRKEVSRLKEELKCNKNILKMRSAVKAMLLIRRGKLLFIT
ncbi:MAG: hypothetical protein WBIAU2_06890 [Wolbachia endosymbiont of Drosophila biauraria]|nr:MAG: hypothetical protein WBIAU2_06890 [Wolbachia endosymbiont of Drosophila biauraria]